MKVRLKRFSSSARFSQKSTVGSAAYNLFAGRTVVLDIGFCFSNTYVTKIYPLSSIFLCSIRFRGGITDSDFRGYVRAILHNFFQNRVEFSTGDRVAQFLFQKTVF